VPDLCFYTYHRSCHEVDSLWAIHKTHHLTKHPSPALGLLADPGQEFLEVILCPTLATLATKRLFPASFGFYEWALCIICINIMEVLGHSGVRAHLPAFATGWVFGVLLPRAVLTIEQHDLHHREGWRRSTNYGKQSLFWDWLFGTLGERREGRDDNVDWSLGLWDAVPAGHTTPPSA
jgi:sterol desaturase/sphingolipid hydroxylase (fatty acid hydroxylase superfamily)